MTANCQDNAKSSDTDLGDQQDEALLLDAEEDRVADNNGVEEHGQLSDTKKFLLE